MPYSLFYVFFTDSATTEIYTLSLHDALPIWGTRFSVNCSSKPASSMRPKQLSVSLRPSTAPSHRYNSCLGFSPPEKEDRKSTRLNSSHEWISYAVFCLKKKIKNKKDR